MIDRIWRRTLSVIIVCVLLLPGCAPFKPKPGIAGLDAAQRRLLDLPYWRLEGRIAIQSRSEGWNANLFWEHEGQQDRVRLSGPFSQGAVSIILQDDLIYINEGDGRTHTSHDPDALLRERLGFAVPLDSLRYWVLGFPAPHGAEPSLVLVEDTPRAFSQAGYQLQYGEFARVGQFELPKRISVRGHELKLKLIADEWMLERNQRIP